MGAPVKKGVVYGADGVWKALRARVSGLDDAHVRVGVLGGSGGGFGMVQLAAVHELGAPSRGIPARSFIRATMVAREKQLGALCGKLAKGVLLDRFTVERALGILGVEAATQVKSFIATQKVRPRLKDSAAGRRTIARKGSSVTLVDTGRLLGSISHKVEMGGRR